jgi:anti-anti-sigma factor
MHIVRTRDGVAIITVDPGLAQGDHDQIEALKELCSGLQDQGYANIVLDMAEVQHAPSLVLGSIIVLQNRIKTRDGELAIVRATERLKRTLDITKMSSVIRIHTDEQEAIKALTGNA